MTISTPMIDTHCHLNFESYDDDRDDVIEDARQQGVNCIIIPAIDVESARDCLNLAQRYQGVYVAVGVHPNSTSGITDQDIASIEQLSYERKVVAIGEIGLDYYWDKSPRDAQTVAFERQLELAREHELPVIIHNREASSDVISILESWVSDLPETLRERPGVLHSFSASAEIADRAIALGFYLGFTGPITFKNAENLRHIARDMPLDRLLVETDGPFLTPHPYRGKRNRPGYIPLIVETLASLHRITNERMAQQTTDNAIRLFSLPDSFL